MEVFCIVNILLCYALQLYKGRKHLKGLASQLWELHKIVYLTRKTFVWENLREFKQICWVYTKMTMDEKSQSAISTIWLVNRILATVIISFLPRFSIWQFSAVSTLCKTHSRTICYVFRPTSVWLIKTRG